MNLAEKMERLGETTNFSEIARRVGVTSNAMSNYRRGTIPAADIAFRLARALGVKLEWLIDDKQDWPPVFVGRRRETTQKAIAARST